MNPFPFDRHPDYYEGARAGASAVIAAHYPSGVHTHVIEAIAAAEQAMREAEERAMQTPNTDVGFNADAERLVRMSDGTITLDQAREILRAGEGAGHV